MFHQLALSRFYPHAVRLLTFVLLVGLAGCGAEDKGKVSSEGDRSDTSDNLATWEGHMDDAIRASEEGDAQATESHLRSALKMAEEMAATATAEPLLDTLTLLGEFYLEVGRHAEAESQFHRAIELAENESADEYAIASVKSLLGSCQNEMEKFEEARTNLEAAVSILEQQSDDPSSLLWPLAQLAIAQSVTDDSAAALDTLHRLVQVRGQQSEADYSAAANTLCWLAEVAMEAGKEQEAKDAIAAAVQLAKEGLLDEEMASYVYQASRAFVQSPTSEPDQAQWSEAKQAAYEELLFAEQRYREAQHNCDADAERWRAGSSYALKNAGRLAAQGVEAFYIHPSPPDHSLQMELSSAQQAFERAKRRFHETP